MKIAAMLAVVSAVTLIWAAPAQDALKPVPEPLAPAPSTGEFDATHWAKALRNQDLVQRKKAYEHVLAEAGRGDDAYEVVTAWALDSSNVELAWTAQLMLRELDTDPLRGLRTLRAPGQGHSLFPGWGHDDLFRELESLLDRHRSTPFGSGPRLKILTPDPSSDWPGASRSEGLSIQSGPDGVKLEIREMIDGQEETKTYEAESMESLLEAHPELETRIGGSGPFRIGNPLRDPDLERFFGDPRTDPFDSFGDPDRGGLRTLKPIEPRTDVLGVRILPPDQRRRPVEGVRSDLGLEVVEVLPGTLADLLGIEVGEIVVAINGVEISSAEDVKRVLAKREKNEPVEVDVVDVNEKNRTRTWKAGPKEERGF